MAPSYDHLIVGGGMVAAAAAAAIARVAPDATIGILSADVDPPYTRPALSKKLWTDPEFTEEKVPLAVEQTGAELRLETTVASVSPGDHTVTLGNDEKIGYGRLLLATGGTPSRLPGLDPAERVLYFRSFADYRTLRRLADEAPAVVVVGGSYIGTELAASLVQNGCDVTLVTPDETLGGSMFPPALAQRFEALFTAAGVDVLGGRKVESGSKRGDRVTLRLDDGSELGADVLVVGLGITPNVGLAEQAGLEIGDGIVVDRSLRTSAADVFAAGDVASYPDAILGRQRVEHVDNAQEMGDAVGRIMAGEDTAYDHTPYYYSVVFGLRYEAIGELDSSLEVIEHWQTPLESGVLYYVKDGRPVGVLIWNVTEDEAPAHRDAARAVLAQGVVPED